MGSDQEDILGGDVYPCCCTAGAARGLHPCWAPRISCTSCPVASPVLEMLDGKERWFYIMRAASITEHLFILMPEQERVDASATHETENQTVWRKKLN